MHQGPDRLVQLHVVLHVIGDHWLHGYRAPAESVDVEAVVDQEVAIDATGRGQIRTVDEIDLMPLLVELVLDGLRERIDTDRSTVRCMLGQHVEALVVRCGCGQDIHRLVGHVGHGGVRSGGSRVAGDGQPPVAGPFLGEVLDRDHLVLAWDSGDLAEVGRRGRGANYRHRQMAVVAVAELKDAL
jgi:hypothetical protein